MCSESLCVHTFMYVCVFILFSLGLGFFFGGGGVGGEGQEVRWYLLRTVHEVDPRHAWLSPSCQLNQ